MKQRRKLALVLGLLLVAAIVSLWRTGLPSRTAASREASPRSGDTADAEAGKPSLLAPGEPAVSPAPREDKVAGAGGADEQAQNALRAFDDWAERYLGTASPEERHAMEAQGQELGALRRVEMKKLIVSDPEQAIRSAVPYEVRMQLSKGVVEQLETPVNTRGDYYVEARLPATGEELDGPSIRRFAEINGESYAVNTYRQGLGRLTRQNTPIHGVAVDGELALNETPYRRLSRAEVAYRQSKGELNGTCKVSGASLKGNPDAAAVDIGGALLNSCTPEHLDADLSQITAKAGAWGGGGPGSGGAALPITPITGTKTFLYIRVRYADQAANYEPQSQASIDQQALDAKAFQEAASFGAASVTVTNTPVYTLPGAAADYANWPAVLAAARVAAAADGFDTANYNYDGVRAEGGPVGGGGVAYIGGKGLAIGGDGVGLFCHEYGHNIGLWHSNSWRAADGTTIGAGQNEEYGDTFDVMGSSGAGMKGHYHALSKYRLGWIPAGNVQTAASGAGALNTYRIHANDQGGALVPALKYGIRLMKDDEREYWLSYRQNAGWSANALADMGAEFHWDAWMASNGTELLDMNPDPAFNVSDATLAAGRTFSDTEADLHFTVTQKIAAAGGNPPALDVVVAKGPFAGNQAPTATLTATPANPAANQATTLNAVANDPNGDALSYYWQSAQGAALGSGSSLNRSWTLPGWKQVTCTVSDMKGMVDVKSLRVPVGAASPAPWSAMEVGATGLEGGDAYDAATGTFTLNGSGADIWGNQDEFRFVYQTMSGDGEIVARVASQQNTNVWAKAGVMIRENLSPGSINAMAAIAPSARNFQWRSTANQASSSSSSAAVAPPHWVKIKRVGNQVTGWFAPDASGVPGAWAQQGAAQNLALSDTVYVGLAVTSHNDAVLGQATFDHVSINAVKVVQPKFFVANTSMGAGTLIGTATVTGGGATGWAITGGNTGGAFAINAAGQLTLQTPAALPNPGAMRLLVRATDANGVVGDGSIHITCNETNLRAWWKLDETTGTLADDSSGTYDGTLNNAPAWSTGYAGGALTFNGSSQYVAVPALGLTSTNTLTISAWVKRSGDQGDYSGIVFDRSTVANGLIFGPDNDLRYSWSGVSGGGWGFASGLTIPDGIWTYCAVVIESDKATLYMQPEGQPLQSKVNLLTHSPSSFGTSVRLAHDSAFATRYFKGQLDEVRVYGRALTPVQLAPAAQVPTIAISSPAKGADLAGPVTVSATVDTTQPVTAVEFYRDGILISSDSSAPYSAVWSGPALGAHTLTARAVHAGGSVDSSPVDIDVVPASNSDTDGDGFARGLEVTLGTDPDNPASKPSAIYSGVRGWWKLDETSGRTAFDSSGNGFDGTLISGPLWVAGIKDGGLQFNPPLDATSSNNNETVQLPALGLNTNSLTISAWVKRRGNQDDWAGIVFDRSAVANGLQFGPDNDLRYSWNGVSGGGWNFASGLTVPDDVWTFCAVVIEPGKATLYMRPTGGAMQSITKTAAHSASAFSTVFLGFDKSSNSRHFRGKMDDVVVHARALSAAEISQLYTPFAPAFTADPIAGAGATEDAAYSGTLAGTATDANDFEMLTYERVGPPTWLNVAADGTLSGTPTQANVGPNAFTVRVTDSAGLSDDATLNITVANSNDAPTWASGTITKAAASEVAAYSGSLAGAASDIDSPYGDTINYSKTSATPGWLNVAADGSLSGTPTNSDVGANTCTVRVTDAAGLWAEATLNITVTNINDAPTWASGTITKTAASEAVAYSGSLAGDGDDTDIPYGDTISYSKVSATLAWLNVAANGSLSGTPTSGDIGLNSFTVRVTDAAGLWANATLQINVVATNNDGIWTNASGGAWPTATNWSGSILAKGAGKTANFSTLNLAADATVTLDGARTVGNLIFGDATTPSHNWILNSGSGGDLTLDATSGAPTITVNNQTATLGLALAGTEGLTKSGGGTLRLTSANTYTGTTTLGNGAGTLAITNGPALGTGSVALTKSGTNGGTLELSNGITVANPMTFASATGFGGGGSAHIRNASGNNTLSGTLTLTGLGGNGINLESATGLLTLSNTISSTIADNTRQLGLGGAGNGLISGNIVDTGANKFSVIKSGTGTWTLSGANTFSGDTTVSGGTLGHLLPNVANVTLAGGTKSIAAGATLKIDFSPQVTQYRKTTLGATSIASGGVLELFGIADNVNGHHLIDSWTATGAGTIRVAGGGSVAAWTAANNALSGFTGLLDIQSGRFACNVNSTATLGGNLDVNIAATGKLDLRSGHFTIDALDGVTGGSIHKSWLGDTINLTIGSGNGSGSFAGIMSGSNYNLIKSGTGTQTLSGTNTNSGTTTISGGTLQVNGALGTGATTVQTGATLAGIGTLGGAVTVQSGGTLSPGVSGIGTLTVNNSVSLAGITTMQIGKSGAALTSDRVSGVSTLTHGGSLVVSNIGPDALVAGNSFTLFSATNRAGSFSSVSLPSPLATGLVWDDSQLTVNGTITVVAGDADADGDGYTNALELALDTNPNSSASQPAAIHSGLRAWWKLDETSGSVADDTTGRPQDGTLANSPAWTTGIKGGALSLNGTNQSVSIPSLGLNTNTATISGWVKRNGSQTNWAGLVFDRGTAVSGLNISTADQLGYHWNDDYYSYSFNSGLTLPDGTWTFCAVVVEPTKATLYMQPVNGSLQSAVKTLNHSAVAFGSNLHLGQDPAGGRLFKGDMDEVRIYNRALSAAEIGQLYTLGNPPAPALGNPYATWAAAHGVTGTSADPDGDGIPNLLEFYLDGDPLAGDVSVLPSVTMDEEYLILSFKRRDDAEPHGGGASIEWGSDLAGWAAVPLGLASTGANADGVSVQVEENGGAPDTITVAIPRALATGGNLFARLKVAE